MQPLRRTIMTQPPSPEPAAGPAEAAAGAPARSGVAAHKAELRRMLVERRRRQGDALARAQALQNMLRVFLVGRRERVIAGYWPIKGEFDPLPALHRWQEAAPEGEPRAIGLPVIDRATRSLAFHAWFPGCPMQEDAYGIPKPHGTPRIEPTLLLLPCVGFGLEGLRLGYGGGFYDRTLAALSPRPYCVGLAFDYGFCPTLEAEPHDMRMDAVITDSGIAWQRAED